jgi:hypothetical protein
MTQRLTPRSLGTLASWANTKSLTFGSVRSVSSKTV